MEIVLRIPWVAVVSLLSNSMSVKQGEDARRQAIERQENPPTDEWVEFPRYELL